MYYDPWHWESVERGTDVLEYSGTLARPTFDSDLHANQLRCVRCGVIRNVKANRELGPLCQDCKGSLTKEQQRRWK